MHKIFTLFIMFSTIFQIIAQCNGRYENEIFENVTVERVVYSNFTNFEMDIYQPEGDTLQNRPLLIIAHGGSFFAGTLENPTMVSLGETFAKRGYVVASMQYTLAANAGLLADSLQMLNVVTQAVADGKAAVRYFRKDKAENDIYKIDANEIWVGGNSAGAILMMHLAYLDEGDNLPTYITDAVNLHGGWEGNRGNDGFSSNVNGVLNLAGGLNNANWILNNTEIPFVSVQGDEDGTVPFDCNDVFWGDPLFGLIDLIDICGSGIINPLANANEIDNDWLVFENEDHTPWELDATKRTQLNDFVTDFVFERLTCNDYVLANNEIENAFNFNIKPNPVKSNLNINAQQFFDVAIFDLIGNKVFEANNNQNLNIDFTAYKNGIYFVNLTTKEGKTTTKKLIKN